MNNCIVDDTRLDGTQLASPAYWRGQNKAIATMCYMINKILDGRDDGTGIAQEPWESVRRRLLKVVHEKTPR